MASLALSLIGALGGGVAGLLGNTAGARTSSPVLNPQQQNTYNTIDSAATYDLQNQPDFNGYQASGLEQINKNANIQSKTIQNVLASRGLSYSPAAVTPLANVEQNRLDQVSDFSNQLSLLKRQFQQQSLSQLMQTFGLLGPGQEKAGSEAGGLASGLVSGALAGYNAGKTK